MRDPRYTKLANLLVHHSCRVTRDDKVLIEAFDIPTDFTAGLIQAVADAGGLPLVTTYQQPTLRALYRTATEEQMKFIGQVERSRMEGVQCYIGVRGFPNICEMSDVPGDRMALYEKWWLKPVNEIRIPKTRWVVLRWPNSAMAQSAGQSTQAFEDFFFRVCVEVDYVRMADAMKPLHELMERTDRVRITGPETELTFSKNGIPTIPCAGEYNIPDGEIFTCPVRDSINGIISFNTETLYRGTVFSNIRLEFKDGKIVSAQAGGGLTARLNEILDADEGARYIGEWSIGLNPYVLEPMKDILFDEKIAGSFHLTPGQAYEEADNGNRSQIHWDMVMIQRKDHGGGDIYFDDVLIRKDGLFVVPELEGLNPDRLG